MTQPNQPYDMPGSRLRWAMTALRDAGINANVTRTGTGYQITVADEQHGAAGRTLGPIQDYSRHPLIIQKKRRNWLYGWLGFTVVGIGGLALLAMSLLGVAPGVLTGLAVWGLAPLMITGLGMPVLMIVVWIYMVNQRVPFAIVVGLFIIWVGAIVASMVAVRAGMVP